MAHYKEEIIRQDEKRNAQVVSTPRGKDYSVRQDVERINYSELAKIITQTLGKDAKGRPNYLGPSYEDSVRAQYGQIGQMYKGQFTNQ